MNSSSLTVHQNDYEVSAAFVVSESCRVSAWLLIDVTATLTCCGFCGLATCLSLLWSVQTFPSACGCSEQGLRPFSRPVMVPTRPVVCADLPVCMWVCRAGSAALPSPCDSSYMPCLPTGGFSWEVPTATAGSAVLQEHSAKRKWAESGNQAQASFCPFPVHLGRTHWFSQQHHVTILGCSFKPGRVAWTLYPGFLLQISHKGVQCSTLQTCSEAWQMLRGQHHNPPSEPQQTFPIGHVPDTDLSGQVGTAWP